MLRFGAAALAWMRERATAEPPGAHLRFSYVPAVRAIRAEVLADGSLPARLEKVMAEAVAADC